MKTFFLFSESSVEKKTPNPTVQWMFSAHFIVLLEAFNTFMRMRCTEMANVGCIVFTSDQICFCIVVAFFAIENAAGWERVSKTSCVWCECNVPLHSLAGTFSAMARTYDLFVIIVAVKTISQSNTHHAAAMNKIEMNRIAMKWHKQRENISLAKLAIMPINLRRQKSFNLWHFVCSIYAFKQHKETTKWNEIVLVKLAKHFSFVPYRWMLQINDGPMKKSTTKMKTIKVIRSNALLLLGKHSESHLIFEQQQQQQHNNKENGNEKVKFFLHIRCSFYDFLCVDINRQNKMLFCCYFCIAQ